MSVFGNALAFLSALGFFDVVLPFILIFVLTYGVLERTNILGYFVKEGKDKEKAVRKKNINAMTAFVLAFIVIGSSKAVSFITTFISKVMLIFVIVTLLVILTASLYGFEGDSFKIEKTYRKWLVAAILVSVGVILFLMIDLNSILMNPNVLFMKTIFANLFGYTINWADVFYTILVLGILFGMMWLIVKEEPKKE